MGTLDGVRRQLGYEGKMELASAAVDTNTVPG